VRAKAKAAHEPHSHRWLGVNDLRAFGHGSRLRQMGYDAPDWAGKPVIGILNTWSDINACHGHLRRLPRVHVGHMDLAPRV
jgi:dihydroxy-acid dehydratase